MARIPAPVIHDVESVTAKVSPTLYSNGPFCSVRLEFDGGASVEMYFSGFESIALGRRLADAINAAAVAPAEVEEIVA